jgi:type II secretion system protein G
MKCNVHRGFTLIELLVVVAIIAVLAAIAVPNFLESQVRAKAARAKADLRTIATALESYATDNNAHYPADNPRVDLAGFLSAPELTTPVAYVSSLKAIIDPFRRDLDFVPADADEVYRYWNLAARSQQASPTAAATNGQSANGSWIVSSAGPDRVDQYPTTGDNLYETLVYDATNGSVSAGDIVRTATQGQK